MNLGAYVLLQFLVQAHGVQGLDEEFVMRFFMCENYEYDLPKCCGKDRFKVLQHTLRVWHYGFLLTSNIIWIRTPPPIYELV